MLKKRKANVNKILDKMYARDKKHGAEEAEDYSHLKGTFSKLNK